MTGLRKKIALFTVASIAMLSIGNAMHISTVIGKTNTAIHSFSNFTTYSNDQESEKLINNVKVFYNPVAEQITLNFTLSQQNTVVIKVMDALGNEVLNLMNGRLDAGLQSLSFDTDGKLSTGFYFVRVSSGTETVVKRISVR
ncbi:T9SS type A sorting domain-containing protein [Sphingobacterium chuzhouense]|uniref:T9SS type A sorting domain-containing protein n=1 Tax=Sphingobacterium chuzhouense TaxID=1742264 RepID=A0ABR7XX42_9SPHI|nr:T9SS type A sorting domain-containing protein [Sphingobacterium chuzhouense]MBD1423617.1 T9SS type A sorting domain-containing protein [Sphingobacterium chuzhouense]